MLARKHPLVQDSAHENAVIIDSVDHDVLLMFCTPVTRPNLVARSAQLWRLSDSNEAIYKPIEIAVGLFEAPNIHGVVGDLNQVKPSQIGKPIFRQLFVP
jgi:hypothetical protein